MAKSKKNRLRRNNLLLGIIIVFLVGITGYVIKAQLYSPGESALISMQQESGSNNNSVDLEDNDDQEDADNEIEDQGSADRDNNDQRETTAGGNGQTTAPGGNPVQEKPVVSGAYSNEKHGWGLKKNDDHQQPEMPSSYISMLVRHGAYWVGNPQAKVIYLTFDEGYENGYTASILDSLKANDVKAAFFVTGHYLDSQPDLVKRMVDEGHIVGNHTETHPSLPDISDSRIEEELRIVEEKYEKVTGRSDMKYLRPPQGEFSERTLAVTRELGYHNIFWSMAAVDWVPMPGGAQQAYEAVINYTHNGAVALMHAVSKDNAEAMDRILKEIKAQGYTFMTLDDLVR